jgi:hypothetical protein
LSNPQEPYQPGQTGAVPQQPPAPPQQPPAPPQHQPAVPYGTPQHAEQQTYGTPQYGEPQAAQGAPHQGEYRAPGEYPATGPFGLPGEQPPVRNRRKLWVILGIVAGVLLLVVLGVVILVNVVGGAANQAKGLADGFTKLVIAGESSKAYDDYLDPALKEQLSKEDFIAGVQSLEMNESCKPAYDDVKVSSENGTNAADVAGIITCDNNKAVELAYRFEGKDAPKMINIKLRPKA